MVNLYFQIHFCIGEFAGVKSLGDFGTDEIKYYVMWTETV